MLIPPNGQRIQGYAFGPLRMDTVSRQLFYKGRLLPLPTRTFDILKILVENRGQLVTKEELIRRVWPDRFVEENNLTVRMSALRKALGESTKNKFIETVPGYGYRFVARLDEVFSKSRESQDEVISSLAVLPLMNENNQQKLDYLCDGLTESLITSLSHIATLRVMARSTVFSYKGQNVDPLRAGRELDVHAVLAGKLIRDGISLVFDFEMIDVRDGAYLWGGRYRRPASNLVTLEEELTKEISEHLRIKLSKVEENKVSKRFTSNPHAHLLYMKGRYFWSKRSVPGLKKAMRYYRNAIKYDPMYALAYAGLADTYRLLSGYGLQPPKKLMPSALAAALKALEIDDQLAEAHLAVANIKFSFEWDWPGAEREFKLAIALNPYDAPAYHSYANFLAVFGRLEEALAEENKAYEIEPLSLSINLQMGKIYYFARRYNEAVKKGREILEIDPQFGPANGLLGMVYLELKRYGDAIKEFKNMIGFSVGDYKVTRSTAGRGGDKLNLPDSDPEALAFLGCAYALAGKRNRAHQILDELRKLVNSRYVQPHTLALVYLGLGEKDKAFEWLERAVTDKIISLTYIKVLPYFDSIRNDPRYTQLVRRINLE